MQSAWDDINAEIESAYVIDVMAHDLHNHANCGADICHCGKPVHIHPDGFTRHLCLECDLVRCDAYPGECQR